MHRQPKLRKFLTKVLAVPPPEFTLKPLYWGAKSRSIKEKLEAVQPVSFAKKFIITLTNLSMSVESANRCLESAEAYGERENIEVFDAIDKFESENFFAANNLKWDATSNDFRSLKSAAMGCFASHYSLWRKCEELGAPIIIMEHDAIFQRSVPSVRFTDVVYLSERLAQSGNQYTNYMQKKIFDKGKATDGEFYYPYPHLYGTECYGITPLGARKLIDAAESQPVFYADQFIRKSIVDIIFYIPSIAKSVSSFTTIWDEQTHYLQHIEFTDRETTWKTYRRNLPGL